MQNRSCETAGIVGPGLAVLPGAAGWSGLLIQEAGASGWHCTPFAEPNQAATLALVVGTAAELAMVAAQLDATVGRIALGNEGPIDAADELLNHDADQPDIMAMLARWSPQPFPAAARRQRDVFGPAAIDALLAGLRDRLAAILMAAPKEARTAAHQLSGLAGILGFAELATAWDSYSTDGESRHPEARRLARLTLATLRRADRSHSAA
jgi:hypothetical protein